MSSYQHYSSIIQESVDELKEQMKALNASIDLSNKQHQKQITLLQETLGQFMKKNEQAQSEISVLNHALEQSQQEKNVLVVGQIVMTLELRLAPKLGVEYFYFGDLKTAIEKNDNEHPCYPLIDKIAILLNCSKEQVKELAFYCHQVKYLRKPIAHPTKTNYGVEINEKTANEALFNVGLKVPSYSIVDAIKILTTNNQFTLYK